MKKAVILFLLVAWTLPVVQDRATSATSTPRNVQRGALVEPGSGPIPLCNPQCPLIASR